MEVIFIIISHTFVFEIIAKGTLESLKGLTVHAKKILLKFIESRMLL